MAELPIPYGRQWIDEADEAAVLEAVRSPFLTQGPRVERFEEELAAFTGAKYAVAVANGTAALHIAALAAGVRPGERALVPDVTFVASANAIRYAGGTPVLCDVDPRTGLVPPETFERRLAELSDGPRVRALVPVDLTGAVADLPRAHAAAHSRGALVIEDAAHSLGATYQHQGSTYRAASCAHADLAILSFHPVKHITTGEGGAVLTNDEAAARDLRLLRSHGITKDLAAMNEADGPWWYEQITLGFNYRITDLQCALGLSQLHRLESFLARRRAVAARYDAALASAPFAKQLEPLSVPPNVQSAYHLYVVRLVPETGEDLVALAQRRLRMFNALRSAGILPQVHYIPLHRQPDFRRNGLATGKFPGADAYYAGCLSLPMFPALADSDVDRVLDVLANALATRDDHPTS